MSTSQSTAVQHFLTVDHRKECYAIPVIRRGLSSDQIAYDQTLRVMAAAPKVTILTGAGISTSAGIPDFRSANGLYKVGLPNQQGKALGSEMFDIRTLQDPQKLRDFGRAMGSLRSSSRNAQPTACHDYIAKLHGLGRLVRCYTQNIDGLQTRGHPQLSGSVLELHGNIHQLQCNRCGKSPDGAVEDVDTHLVGTGLAYCTKCQERGTQDTKWRLRQLPPGLLLPKVMLNEESWEVEFDGMTMDELELADGSASLLLVIGTSIRTHGAIQLVKSLSKKVHQTGGGVVYVDRSELRGSKWRNYFDLHIQAEIDEWARDCCAQLSQMSNQIDTGTEIRKAIRGILCQNATLAPEEKALSMGSSTDRQNGLKPRPPHPELVVPHLTSKESDLVILVCHSGAAPLMAQAMAFEVMELAKQCGRICYGYVVVLSGSEEGLHQVPVRENFHLLVVHVSDYMLRLRNPWRPIEPGQTIQELLKRSVSVIGSLSKQSKRKLLMMLCAEDELLEMGGISRIHELFTSQSAFGTMIASLNMFRLGTRSWAKFAVDVMLSHIPPSDLVDNMAMRWMSNSDLFEASDMVVFQNGGQVSMLLASSDDRPLGKELPDINSTCWCKSIESASSGKAWLVHHDAINGCPAKDVSTRVQCSSCDLSWSLDTSSLVGTVRCLERKLCVIVEYGKDLVWA